MSKSNIIIPRIFGGLGNQLFIYAAARRLSLSSNADLALDAVSGFRNDSYGRSYQLEHFNISARKAGAKERLEPFSRVRRGLKRKINKYKPFYTRQYIQQEGVAYDPRLLDVVPRGAVYLEGLWQSEKYFIDMENQIRKDLEITPPCDEVNLSLSESILNHTAVAIHVRFFGVQTSNVLNNYYKRAVTEMERRIPGAQYYLFSDRPEDARELIPLPDERITTVNHNHGDMLAYIDLWLMTKCQHFIIANSTFSWWGAWLGDGGVVIAPGISVVGKNSILPSWGFEGLLPERWIKL